MALRVLSRATGGRFRVLARGWLSSAGGTDDSALNSSPLYSQSSPSCASQPDLLPHRQRYHHLAQPLDHRAHTGIASQSAPPFAHYVSTSYTCLEQLDGSGSFSAVRSVMSRALNEKEIERAADIGYRIQGTLDASEAPVKLLREPVFAVVQVGSHQFKVTPGDAIYVEKLLAAEVNDKVALGKVLLLGSKDTTVIGRPYIPSAAVSALVEEHFMDARVIIFKKKRRKNHRRTNGHRQELTRLRILEVNGLEEHVGHDLQVEEETPIETRAVASA